MRKLWKQLPLLFLLMAVMVNCKDEEMEYLDPMVYGLAERAENELIRFSKVDRFTDALFGIREQRIKLAGMKRYIEKDGYSGDNYGLENKTILLQYVDHLLTVATFKLDSAWQVNIKNDFDAINPNSAGIQNFGVGAYELASTRVDNAKAWLMAESHDETEDEWLPLDFINLQTSLVDLLGLSNLDEQEVLEFVAFIRTRFATMQQQYSDMATEVATSPFFSKAQKEMYANLEGLLTDLAVNIEQNLSLLTVNELDAVDRDLAALVYFIENNYTSPAQQPLVDGEIASITELRWLSEHGSADDYSRNWKLVVNIDAAETRRWNEGFGYLPISEFSGTFDGQYHIISGLYMNDFPDYHTGLFGRLVDGEIKNLGLVNVDIITRQPQGGALVGVVLNGTLTNCFSHGRVELSGQSGGFVGNANLSTFTNCFTFAHTQRKAAGNHGAFAGLLRSTNLVNCYSAGLNESTATNSNAFVGSIADTDVTAVGTFYDSTIAVLPQASNQDYFNALVIPIPTASWGTLANFPTYSEAEWEIVTVTEIDPNPRPYIKAFNYNVLKDFIIPDK